MSLPTYPGYKDSGVDWLGTVPEHWDSKRLKFLFDLVKREIREEDRIVTCFRDGAVTLRDNRRTDGFTNAVKEIGYQGIRIGDLVIHAMDAFAGAIGVSDSDGKSTPVYSVCTPVSPSVSSNYYARLLRNMAVAGFVSSLAKGIRERSTDFRWVDAGEIFLPVPSETEQRKIVSFLDHETARINALIEEQQRLIELLKEKRHAVISQAVTKGLDPTVPMKDSDVEWLGEVPAHWGVKALRYLGECQNGINIGGEAFGSGSPFVSYGDVYKNDVLPAEVTGLVQSSPEDQQRYSIEYGDVFFTRTSETVDEIGFSATCLQELPNAVFAGFLIRFRPTGKSLTPGFSKYYFRNQGLRIFFNKEMNLVTRASLSQDLLKLLPVTLPPVVEQIKISDFLDRVTAEFASLLEQGIKAIDLLKERRSALISAAVTGKIDVRGWQPPANTQAPESVQEAV